MLSKRKKMIFFLCAGIIFLVIFIFRGSIVTPTEDTIRKFTILSNAIAKYLEDHESVPENLSELPEY